MHVEGSALGARDIAERALDLERLRGEEWARSLEAAAEQSGRRAAAADAEASAAARELARLEAGNAAAGAEAVAVARLAAADAERRRGQTTRLEANLEEVRCQQRVESAREREANRELAQVRAEAAACEASAAALEEELAGSERLLGETERKALGVARELLDTSQAIARLRAEAAAQRGLRQELEEAHRERGLLEQRLAAVTRRASAGTAHATSATLARPASPTADMEPSTVSAGSAAGASTAPASTPAQAELRLLRASQERAVNEALRAAWEAEVRNRRATEARLEALEANWLPLREWLVRLTAAAHRWRADFFASSPGGVLPAMVPPPPAEPAWRQEAQLPDAARALCDCLEALAVEVARGLAEARGGVSGRRTIARGLWEPGPAPAAPPPWARREMRGVAQWPASPLAGLDTSPGDVSSLLASPSLCYPSPSP